MIQLLLLIVFLLGILSMGFQLVASRILSPWYGSSIIVWAFLISVFLSGFAAGSFLGGRISSLAANRRGRAVLPVLAFGASSLACAALFHDGLIERVTSSIDSDALGIALTCGVLFLTPVTAMATLSPIAIQLATDASPDRFPPGRSAGVIYGTSTVGNITGVLATAILLIPSLGVNSILLIWFVLVTLCYACFYVILTKPTRK